MRLARPAALLALAGLTACTGSPAAEPSATPSPAGPKGGTLRVLTSQPALATDPQRARTPADADVDRLLFRTLTAFPTAPGAAGADAVADLATSTGTPSDGAKTWTFTLRAGVRFADGSPVTAADVRYGVERAFDPKLGGPPGYVTAVLDCGAKYAGPASGDCPAVDVPDDRTVVFHLSHPVGDFPDVVALPAFAPVPQGKAPSATGPYVVQGTAGSVLTLARNDAWKAADDPVRPAAPDRVEIALGLDPDAVAQRLAAATGDDAAAVALGVDLDPARAAALLADRRLDGRVDRSPDGSIDLLLLRVDQPPLDNVAVRTAFEYAVSRAAYRQALGGGAAGEFASTLLPPSLPAYRAYDLYPTTDAGAPADARSRLARAGYPDGLTLPYVAGDGVPAAARDAVVTALARAGITLHPVSGGAQPSVGLLHFVPDRPAAAAYLRPLLCACGADDPSHYAGVDVQRRIDAASASPRPGAAWAQAEQRALQDAPLVPLLHRDVVRLRGPKVRGAHPDPAFGGEYDLAALAVGD